MDVTEIYKDAFNFSLPAHRHTSQEKSCRAGTCTFSTSHLPQQLKITCLLTGRTEPCNSSFQVDVRTLLCYYLSQVTGRHKSMPKLKEIILNCRMVYRWVLKVHSRVRTQDKSITYRGLTHQDLRHVSPSNTQIEICWIQTPLELKLFLVDLYTDTQIKRNRR